MYDKHTFDLIDNNIHFVKSDSQLAVTTLVVRVNWFSSIIH